MIASIWLLMQPLVAETRKMISVWPLRSFVLDMAFAKRTTVPNSLIKGSNIGSLDLTPRKGKTFALSLTQLVMYLTHVLQTL